MSVSNMMKQHTIVDINECLHVIDGKVIYYDPDTIDFESEKQVENLLGMATDLFVNDFFTEEYGHGNTMLVISGCKEYVDKYVNIEDMVHVPPELKEKVQQVIAEYRNKELKTMSIHDMMNKHVIVDIDDYVHVIDGKVICYEPDAIDFESQEQVKNLFEIVSQAFVHELLPEDCGRANTRIIISGKKEIENKWVFTGYIDDFPSEVLEKVRTATDEYKKRTSNTV